jgi:hypothetical protein
MSDTRLQQLYSQALARRSDAHSVDCVTPEQLVRLVQREGAESDRLAILDQVMGCPACQREFNLLRALESSGRRITAQRPVRSIGRRLAPLALAASLLLAVGVGLLVRNRSAGDTVRGGGGQLTLLSPDTEVAPGRPITFAWRSVAGVNRYRMEVLDQAGKPIFSETTRDTTVTWPAAQLRPGEAYQWWVRDVAPGSHLVSPVRPLRVRSQ